jgi:hypothetical protein
MLSNNSNKLADSLSSSPTSSPIFTSNASLSRLISPSQPYDASPENILPGKAISGPEKF